MLMIDPLPRLRLNVVAVPEFKTARSRLAAVSTTACPLLLALNAEVACYNDVPAHNAYGVLKCLHFPTEHCYCLVRVEVDSDEDVISASYPDEALFLPSITYGGPRPVLDPDRRGARCIGVLPTPIQVPVLMSRSVLRSNTSWLSASCASLIRFRLHWSITASTLMLTMTSGHEDSALR